MPPVDMGPFHSLSRVGLTRVISKDSRPMTLLRRSRLTPLLAAAAVWSGCAHTDSFDGRVFRKAGVAVRVGDVPSGWRRIAVDGADLAFRDEARGGSALFDVRCGLRDDDAP